MQRRPGISCERRKLGPVGAGQVRIGSSCLEIIVSNIDDLPNAERPEPIDVPRGSVTANDAGPADRIDVRGDRLQARQPGRALVVPLKVSNRIEEIKIRRRNAAAVFLKIVQRRKIHRAKNVMRCIRLRRRRARGRS
jgi:hypothetical protein